MTAYIAESKRLWLQPLSLDHLHDFQSIVNDSRSNLWAISEDSRKVFTDELATAFILDNKPSLEKPWNRRWAVMLRPPLKFSSDAENLNHEGEGISGNPKPQMIGIIGIPRPSEIGYKMHPDFWGKGYMTEALGLAINIFWESEDGIHDKLIAAADPENKPSIRILEKHGFQKGELKRDFYERKIDGRIVKAHMQFHFLERPVGHDKKQD